MHLVYVFLLSLLVAACSMQHPADSRSAYNPTGINTPLLIDGLRPCSAAAETELYINRAEPVIVLTHGCLDSAARFTALADVFAFQGQQAICFTYDDRDSLVKSATEMRAALDQLSEQLDNTDVTVIAHSQGGLIARKALTDQAALKSSQDSQKKIALVTISAPFSGIEAASHCGSEKWRAITLGLVNAICWVISGDKWFEITDASEFIQNPGPLAPQLSHHLKIDTNEQGSCRKFGAENECLESDYVFSLNEQQLLPVKQRAEVNRVVVQAGHTEIVGDVETPPHKLITILQQQRIMKETQPENVDALNTLLSRIY